MSEIISFPCEYLLKIVSVPHPDFPTEILNLAEKYGELRDCQLNHSRRGNYASLSLKLYLETEASLASFYETIKSKPYIQLIF